MKPFFPLMSGLLLLALVIPMPAQSNPPAAPGNTAQGSAVSGPDPLLDPQPLPTTPVTLVGGVVRKIDPIRARLLVGLFGGGTMKMSFDNRSRFFRDGMETTMMGVHAGDRVYVDTQLDRANADVLARNIRVVTAAGHADITGQVLQFFPKRGFMTVQDRLSGQAVNVQVTPATAVTVNGQRGSQENLGPGALVAVQFDVTGTRGQDAARAVNVLAEPGALYTFTGRVTYLDLRTGSLAIDNVTDSKNYVVNVSRDQVPPTLTVGSDVTVKARFDGRHYAAQDLTVQSGPQESGNPSHPQ